MSPSFTPNPAPDQPLRDAEAALRAGNPQRAVAIYQAVLRQNPNAAEAHHALARVLMSAGQLAPARQHITRAGALRPTDPDIVRSLGEVLFACRDHAGALDAFERLRRLTPGVADPHADAATLHDALGAPDKAREALAQALAVDPNHPRALTLHIKLALQGSDKPDDDALNEFRATLERIAGEATDPTARALAYRLLGQVTDRLADSDAAFAAYTKCNETDAAGPGMPRAHMREGYLKALSEMAQVITPERALRWAGEAHADGLPEPAFVVGFPGSGTTLLERALDAHPRLVALDEKPTLDHTKAMLLRLPSTKPISSHHIADVIEALTPEQVTALRREYWRRVDEQTGPRATDALTLDKMPLRITDLPFINRIFPRARVIVALRDPRDVCLSCYIKRFGANIPMSFFLDLHDTARFYEQVMGTWLRTRDLHTFQWMQIRYEDVVADFQARAKEVLSFLDLSWDEAVLSFHDRTAQEAPRTSTTTLNYHSVRRGIDASAAGRWKKYERQLAPILPTLQPFVEAFGYASH